MRGAGHHLDGRVDARGAQPPGVLLVLVVEQVDVADPDPGRRQAGEVGAAGRDGVVGDVRGAGGDPEVGAPAEGVEPVVPDPVVDGVQLAAGGGAVVEHGAEQPLRGRGSTPGVVQALGEPGGQATTRALPADRDPGRVDAQPRRGLLQPFPARDAVVERGREAVPGRQPVLDRNDHHAQLPRRGRAEPVVLHRGPDDQPAAVDPQQRRVRPGHPRAVHAQPQPGVGAAVDDGQVDAVDLGRGNPLHHGRQQAPHGGVPDRQAGHEAQPATQLGGHSREIHQRTSAAPAAGAAGPGRQLGNGIISPVTGTTLSNRTGFRAAARGRSAPR